MRGSFGGLRCCVEGLPQAGEGKLEEGGREEVGELQEIEHGAQTAELGVNPAADILASHLPLVACVTERRRDPGLLVVRRLGARSLAIRGLSGRSVRHVVVTMSGSFPHRGGQQPADTRRPGAWERFEVGLVSSLVGAAEGHPLEPGDAPAGRLPGLVAKIGRRGVGGCAVLIVAGAGGSGAVVAGTRGR